MMMNKDISQSDDLAKKTNRKWEELPSLMWNFSFFEYFFLFFVFVLFVRVCEPYVSLLSFFFPTADFSAMHHGTIDC